VTETAAEQAGRRAARNTGARAAAELVGKLATLALFAAVARALGEEELGVLVFAFAFLEIALTPIGFGMNGYLLRQVARDRGAADRLFFNVLALKLAVAVPVLALGFAAVFALGYDHRTRVTILVLGVALFLDALAKSFHALFNAHERGDLVGAALVAQRVITAAVGIAALLAGAGIVLVAAIYMLGACVHVALSIAFALRTTGMPARRVGADAWGPIVRASYPFAAQDVFTVLLFKLDAVLLSLLTVEAVVGRYGAAYRLIDSTLFVSYALIGAFSAMFAYLGADTDPPLQSVYGRALKLSLLVLVPVALALGLEAEAIVRLIYGGGLAAAAEPLRLLAPLVVLLSLVAITTTLLLSRRGARRVAPITAGATALNVALNLVLIPPFEDEGAALAMLATELVLAAVLLVLAHRTLGGGVGWPGVVAAPAAGGAALAAALALIGPAWAALAVGALVYVGVAAAVEHALNPADLRFALGLLRRRAAATPLG
jgi:O-antigen/teichoic acid export membrane protein